MRPALNPVIGIGAEANVPPAPSRTAGRAGTHPAVQKAALTSAGRKYSSQPLRYASSSFAISSRLRPPLRDVIRLTRSFITFRASRLTQCLTIPLAAQKP